MIQEVPTYRNPYELWNDPFAAKFLTISATFIWRMTRIWTGWSH